MTSYVEVVVRYEIFLFSISTTQNTKQPHIYFYGDKIKLRGSKGHITVEIVRKRPKRRDFGHKMTSYLKIGRRCGKIFFSKLSTNTTDTPHIYFYGSKMKLNGSKSRKYPKKRVFPMFPI